MLFSPLLRSARRGSAVRVIAPSPALDVVGVGLADGRAVLANLRYDAEVASFQCAAGAGAGAAAERFAGSERAQVAGGGAVTAISFRTGPGLPLMAAGGGSGVVTVWNLEERRLHAVLPDAHDARLLALHFFPGEPLLMSSAADNAIKQWVFDGHDAVPRLLRFRSGHAAPPSMVAHYAEGLRLLSGGADRAFRVFSTIQDQQSRELSQRHTARRAKRARVREEEVKLPRIVGLAAAQARERDWANVLTAHEGDGTAYTWRLANFALGEARLVPPADQLAGAPPAPVTAVAASPCGNFGVVGSAAGRVDRYNMQSGGHRGVYTRRVARGAAGAADPQQRAPAHDGAVAGVAVDGANRLLVTLGAVDGALRVWDFKRQALVTEVAVGGGATHLALHPGSGLAAVACSDAVLRLYDVEAGRLVRRFTGHRCAPSAHARPQPVCHGLWDRAGFDTCCRPDHALQAVSLSFLHKHFHPIPGTGSPAWRFPQTAAGCCLPRWTALCESGTSRRACACRPWRWARQ
jgi:U3 small nucleolar RNA-associated protein 21